MNFLKDFILSTISTMGFAILLGSPSSSILKSGIIGGIGWTAMVLIDYKFNSLIFASFFAALLVGSLGEAFAKKDKKPATVYIIPGIIPLVPGAGMYYTMLALVENDFLESAMKGTETFFIAIAISIGITISTALSRSIKRVKFLD